MKPFSDIATDIEPLNLKFGTMIVSFVISSKCSAKYIIINIHRFLFSVCHRNINHDDSIFFLLLYGRLTLLLQIVMAA